MTQAAGVAAAAIQAIADQAATPLLQESVNAIRGTAGKLEAWFGSMMDRVAQKFTIYMRLWTVLFASAFAIATGLNSISLLSELYNDSALRSALAGAAQQATATAATVLDKGNTLAAGLTGALKQAVQDANTSRGAATAGHPDHGRRHRVDSGQPARRTTRGGARQLRGRLRGRVAEGPSGWRAERRPGGRHRLPGRFRHPQVPLARPSERQGYFLGVLITAALLSLGAPFWFNVLKSLANLRPILASKEKAEQK